MWRWLARKYYKRAFDKLLELRHFQLNCVEKRRGGWSQISTAMGPEAIAFRQYEQEFINLYYDTFKALPRYEWVPGKVGMATPEAILFSTEHRPKPRLPRGA